MQNIFNISYGTYFIYMLIERSIKYFSRSDYDGIPYLNKITDNYNSFIIPTNIIISCALCNFILTFLDRNIITEFLLLYMVVNLIYKMLYSLMNTYVETFRQIDPSHKKMYVIKNFVKSLTLAGLCIVVPIVSQDMFYGIFDIAFFKRCAIYYTINDVMGLLLVRKLPRTTVIHHTTTILCGILTQFKKDDKFDIIILIIIYAIFSSIAFIVNFYLGYRIFSDNNRRKQILSITSFWIYLISCVINWTIQLYLAIQLFMTSISQFSLYVAFFISVARDDVILMKWLYDDHNKFKNN